MADVYRGRMSESKSIHIWMPDGRSLCDRRARQNAIEYAEATDDQVEQYLRDETEAPACGSCIVLAGHMRHKAACYYSSPPARCARRRSEAPGNSSREHDGRTP